MRVTDSHTYHPRARLAGRCSSPCFSATPPSVHGVIWLWLPPERVFSEQAPPDDRMLTRSGVQRHERLVDHHRRPDQRLEDGQQVLEEPVRLLPEVDQRAEDAEAVDRAAA